MHSRKQNIGMHKNAKTVIFSFNYLSRPSSIILYRCFGNNSGLHTEKGNIAPYMLQEIIYISIR